MLKISMRWWILLPNCQNCGSKWTWKDTFVKMFTFKNKLRCPSCEHFQYLSKKSRNQLSLFVMCPFLIWVPLVSFNVPIQYIFAVEISSYFIVLMSMPFFYRLSNEEEPMW